VDEVIARSHNGTVTVSYDDEEQWAAQLESLSDRPSIRAFSRGDATNTQSHGVFNSFFKAMGF
jgi:hypothetical protein